MSKKLTLLVLVATIALTGQTASRPNNPNYPKRNPFYFEGRITWELLGIDVPRDAWEYLQRGIHRQDDLEDKAGAIDDYKAALARNNLANKSCQLVTAANSPPAIPASAFVNLDPPPCMFTPRLRLANLLLESDPHEAIRLLQEVLEIDPLRLDVNAKIGEGYVVLAGETSNAAEKTEAYEHAIAALQAELALTPVNALTVKVTGDEATNAHVHWELAEVYQKLGRKPEAIASLENYLKATKWHSDTYPWRIALAQKKIEALRSNVSTDPVKKVR